jgi:hypothetical protein
MAHLVARISLLEDLHLIDHRDHKRRLCVLADMLPMDPRAEAVLQENWIYLQTP